MFLRDAKIAIGITIHNVPPEECGLSWKDDHPEILKDLLRKSLFDSLTTGGSGVIDSIFM